MHLHLVKSVQEAGRPAGPTRAGLTGHDVQFYRSEEYLVRSVANFLVEGIRAGQPIVVIATEPHCKAFAKELTRRGLDPDEVLSGREAILLDARDTLASFMEGRVPNRELFFATVGNVFERLLKKRDFLVVRGYGEMVDLLAKDGNVEGASTLEELWNELAGRFRYSLLCGYSFENFLHAAGATDIRRLCHHHTHSLPLEA
jgi:hypothetical protein